MGCDYYQVAFRFFVLHKKAWNSLKVVHSEG